EWVHVQLHQQKGMISLSPPTICNSAKKPSQQALNRAAVTVEQAEALAQRLADKPYGAPEKPEPEKQCRTTISLGESMLVTIEDLALRNKRNGKDPKNVSAIVRVALEQYLKTLT
ncbi:ribbon-helix-helix domain-containing protein, partial [Escherichia coli]